MAWSVITDSVLQVGRPIRALTMRLLRDNITAMANGDAGAPRIQRDALQSFLISADKIGPREVREAALAVGIAERDWVMNLYAAGWNQRGVLVWAERVATPGLSQQIDYGTTYAGADLRAAGLRHVSGVVTMSPGPALAGTWVALGFVTTTVEAKQTLFMRVA